MTITKATKIQLFDCLISYIRETGSMEKMVTADQLASYSCYDVAAVRSVLSSFISVEYVWDSVHEGTRYYGITSLGQQKWEEYEQFNNTIVEPGTRRK